MISNVSFHSGSGPNQNWHPRLKPGEKLVSEEEVFCCNGKRPKPDDPYSKGPHPVEDPGPWRSGWN